MTGETTPGQVAWIDTALWPGRLGLSPDQELADLGRLARQGVNVLALLIGPHEGERWDLPEVHALTVIACPIQGQAGLHGPGPFTSFLEELMEHLLDGRAVVVHGCGEPGWAGLSAVCLLIQAGMPPEQAVTRVRAACPGAIGTTAHEQFVDDFAAR
ncbi:hypothetical protein [Deinococcus sp. YIM 77859]|uniref:hypothetical protein n=1 Tax=Deinococcus sp. YIM 77859 TaxID=1540221 RepID=UPI00054FC5F5|nr:hypothetical protein [Deinococcus sp. YIM 77859]